MNYVARIMEVLQEGPDTAAGISSEIGIDVHNIAARLQQLYKQNRVVRRAFFIPGSQRPNVWLYSMPEHRV